MASLRKHMEGTFASSLCSVGLHGFRGAIPEKEEVVSHFDTGVLTGSSSPVSWPGQALWGTCRKKAVCPTYDLYSSLLPQT